MANRGKKRLRKDGTMASGKRSQSPSGFSPLMINLLETPIPAVLPDQLALAITIGNTHAPIAAQDDDDGLQRYFDELKRAVADDALAQDIDGRAYQLRRFLQGEGSSFYETTGHGVVKVRPDLLAFAASTPMTDSPDEQLVWSPAISAPHSS